MDKLLGNDTNNININMNMVYFVLIWLIILSTESNCDNGCEKVTVKMYYHYIYDRLPMLNFWLIMLLTWLVIDIYRYIRYILMYRRLNQKPEHRDTNHDNIKKMLNDLKTYPNILEELIHDLFFNRIRMEDMNFEDVCTSLFEMIGEYEEYRGDVKLLIKRFQLIQRKNNRNVFTSGSRSHRVRHNKHDIVAWFNILPIYLITKITSISVETYMKFLGYKYYCYQNGLKIWYSEYDPNKGTPLVFFHASVGGVTAQIASLRHFYTNYNIIMPEIPGVSFIDTYDLPPPISEIVNNVHEFISNQYGYHTERINLMGHSLGCTICSAYINMYPKYIDNMFCVEGQIFFPRALRISEDFASKIEDVPTEDLITVPLFHRDLYVQYFIIKRLTLDSTMIFDMDGDDYKNISIHMYHIKDDRKILIRPQLEYAAQKNIKLVYHLFEGEYSHGSFALNKKIRKYVMDSVQTVYNTKMIPNDTKFDVL